MTLTRRTAIASAAIASAAIAGVTLAAAMAEAEGKHPEIDRAMRALENAKKDLEAAKHDYDGHRAEAVKACDHALEELRLALKSADAR